MLPGSIVHLFMEHMMLNENKTQKLRHPYPILVQVVIIIVIIEIIMIIMEKKMEATAAIPT